jgi:outer membrane protein assembly factor BamB
MQLRFNQWLLAAILTVSSFQRYAVASDDWPCWRGPDANNHASSTRAPTHWGEKANVAWSVDVSGTGHASPVVCGDKIFLASADVEQSTQFLLSFDRNSGALLWKTQLHHAKLPAVHVNNSHASATPACDGKAVFVPMVCSDQLWLSCVELNGRIRWQQKIGGFRHANGYGSSPALFGDTVILVGDNQEDAAMVALACSDGHVVWRTERPKSDNSATPVVGRVANRDQLLINGAKAIISYDPSSGCELWRVSHGCEVAANTMTFDEECVYASGNVPEKMLMAVRANGNGDVTNTHVLWNLNRSNPYVPSPLVIGDRLLTVIDNGTVLCRDARTGEETWKRRLSGNFFSSPVLAGEHVYAVSEEGVVYVFQVGDEFVPVAENEMGDKCMATPAICGDAVYLRTATHLVCIRGGGQNP